MSIELSPDLERRVSDAIRSGHFGTPEELVETAVRRLLDPVIDASSRERRRGRLSLDPPLIPADGRHIDLTNEQIYELIELA